MARRRSKEKIEKLVSENQLTNSENNLTRYPASSVDAFTEKVRTGNYREISVISYGALDAYTGSTVLDRRKKFEYYSVAMISGGLQAAISGGLPPDLAYDIGDALLEQLAACDTIEEMHDITENGLRHFARQVSQTKHSRNSYTVEETKTYITKHIFQKIYLEDIADHLKVNPAYLSHLFSAKTGVTISNYIQKEKVERACNLLKFSDRSIADIAQYLSYKTQSHFSQVFRRYTGVSPAQYRNSQKSLDFSSHPDHEPEKPKTI